MLHFLPPQLIALLRAIRDFMEFFGDMNIHGFPLDWIFHLIVAFFLMFFLTKFISAKKSVWIVCFLIVLKEIVDVFAKSSTDYIVPPAIDTPKDIIAGLVGIYLYFKYRKHVEKKKSTTQEKDV